MFFFYYYIKAQGGGGRGYVCFSLYNLCVQCHRSIEDAFKAYPAAIEKWTCTHAEWEIAAKISQISNVPNV